MSLVRARQAAAVPFPFRALVPHSEKTATPRRAAALPHSLSLSSNAAGDSPMGRVH